MLRKPFKSFVWNDYTKQAWVLDYEVNIGDELLVTYKNGKTEKMPIQKVKPIYEVRVDNKKVQGTIEGLPVWLVTL